MLAEESGSREAFGFVRTVAARCATEEDDFGVAEAGYREALAAYEEIGAQGRAGWVQTMLGGLELRRGNVGLAEKLLRDAVSRLRATQEGIVNLLQVMNPYTVPLTSTIPPGSPLVYPPGELLWYLPAHALFGDVKRVRKLPSHAKRILRRSPDRQLPILPFRHRRARLHRRVLGIRHRVRRAKLLARARKLIAERIRRNLGMFPQMLVKLRARRHLARFPLRRLL